MSERRLPNFVADYHGFLFRPAGERMSERLSRSEFHAWVEQQIRGRFVRPDALRREIEPTSMFLDYIESMFNSVGQHNTGVHLNVLTRLLSVFRQYR